MNEIKGFFGEYRWLSNFWYITNPIVDKFAIPYYTNEHYYQACKSDQENVRLYISLLKSPGEAKKAGAKITKRANWHDVSLDVMREGLEQKFTKNNDLKQKLLDTGDAYLEETNTWKDFFYGVCNGIGENHLGKLLMQLREQLRKL